MNFFEKKSTFQSFLGFNDPYCQVLNALVKFEIVRFLCIIQTDLLIKLSLVEKHFRYPVFSGWGLQISREFVIQFDTMFFQFDWQL